MSPSTQGKDLASKGLFVMAGGGTGGHVIPGIAVARELSRMGYEVLFCPEPNAALKTA